MDFYTEFRELVLSQPRNATHSRAIENAAYGDYIYRSKNAYLSFFLNEAEDCYYCDYLMKAKDCVDCSFLTESELCYSCIDCTDLYNCAFLQDCHNCSNLEFCIDCINCKDCFGSFGLRNQRFCIFNRPYSEDTYKQKLNILKNNTPEKILSILSPEFEKHPRLFARQLKGDERCLGDYIYFSKNCHRCFNVYNVQDAAYVSEIFDNENGSRDCVDCDFGSNLELCYDCQTVLQCTNCTFMSDCSLCADCEYCIECYNCQNCFGCAYLMNKEYCILNRQFTREEYLYALKKIKDELKQTGKYGRTLAKVLNLNF